VAGTQRNEVIMKVPAWATSAIGIGFAATLAACSSTAHTAASATSPASGASSSSAAPGTAPASTAPASTASSAPAETSVPAGYQRVGGAAQGISFAVPGSWAAINLAKQTEQQAAQKLGLQGVSANQLVQDMQSLQKLHGLVIYDVKSAVDSPAHFATTLNAYCTSSGVTDTGSASLPLLRQETMAGMQQIHAEHITQKDVTVGGVPGLQTSYTLSSSGSGTLEGAQLEVLPKADRACFMTLTAAEGAFPSTVLPVVAATAAYS
jgi:hypothetical protein